MILQGPMSTFGGPLDDGMSASEGLALVELDDLKHWWFRHLFLDAQPIDPKTGQLTTGLGRRLNPDAFYIACRWDYDATPKSLLRNSVVKVSTVDRVAFARPVDWGPNLRTGRVADMSPGLADALLLGMDDNRILQTDSIVRVELIPGI